LVPDRERVVRVQYMAGFRLRVALEDMQVDLWSSVAALEDVVACGAGDFLVGPG
jgi:hypothetical protein